MNAYVLFVTYVWRTWDDIFFVVIVVVFTLRTYTYLVRVVTDDDCYTDEETRRRHCKPIGIMKEKMREVGSRHETKQENRTGTQEARHKKSNKIVLKASVVTKFPVSASNPSRAPCHTTYVPSSSFSHC